jgi:hypothetical protein
VNICCNQRRDYFSSCEHSRISEGLVINSHGRPSDSVIVIRSDHIVGPVIRALAPLSFNDCLFTGQTPDSHHDQAVLRPLSSRCCFGKGFAAA